MKTKTQTTQRNRKINKNGFMARRVGVSMVDKTISRNLLCTLFHKILIYACNCEPSLTRIGQRGIYGP